MARNATQTVQTRARRKGEGQHGRRDPSEDEAWGGEDEGGMIGHGSLSPLSLRPAGKTNRCGESSQVLEM